MILLVMGWVGGNFGKERGEDGRTGVEMGLG